MWKSSCFPFLTITDRGGHRWLRGSVNQENRFLFSLSFSASQLPRIDRNSAKIILRSITDIHIYIYILILLENRNFLLYLFFNKTMNNYFSSVYSFHLIEIIRVDGNK